MATDIVLRSVKAAALTHAEMDRNWESLAQTVDVVTVSATIAVADQNKIIECDISSGTMTLPTIANAAGTDTDSYHVTFKNINSTSLIVNGNGGETIEGAANITLLQNESAVIGLDGAGTGWVVLSFYNPNLIGITATATELNIMDGVTASTVEINAILTGRKLASTDDVIDNFPSGTLQLFQQTAAPTGWTKQTTHNDKSLRVVSGTVSTGGAIAFSSLFGTSKTTDGHALTTAQLASHSHTTTSAGTHSHTINIGGPSEATFPALATNGANATAPTSSAGAHTHTISSTGSGSLHTHNLSNFDLQFVDIVIASKD